MDLSFLRTDLESYWNEKAIKFVPSLEYTRELPDLEQFLAYFSNRFDGNVWQEPVSINVNASRVADDGSVLQRLNIDLRFARELYLQGFTVCFGDLSDKIGSIGRLKTIACEIFGYPESIFVTAYLSPPGATGVLHYDRQHNFFFQRSGVKRWFVSNEAALVNPHENFVFTGVTQATIESMEAEGCRVEMPRNCGVSCHLLEKGQVLYVPPGFYHSPETLEVPSLHFTLTLEPVCVWKDLQKDLEKMLKGSDRCLFQDYRTLGDKERNELFQSCYNLIRSRVLKDTK